jgi:hypothetical protein
VAIFGIQSTSKFNDLQLNSLRKREQGIISAEQGIPAQEQGILPTISKFIIG